MQMPILYISSVILGGAGAWLISRYAVRLGLMDVPNERSSHEVPMPVPKGGGIGILVAFIIAAVWLGMPVSFWLSATLLALLSLFGDRVDILPKFRLLVQFIAALVLLWAILFSDSGSFGLRSWDLSPLTLVLCCVPLSVFIVGTANFYNFMDGINGIAGITGAVGFGLLGSYAWRAGGDPSAVALTVCMFLACLAFLPFNMPMAKVFMGDVGSILLGFVFAGMVVGFSKEVSDFVCMAAFIFPFYADELGTLVIRLKHHCPQEANTGYLAMLAKPHRRHVYQLLVNELKLPHWKVSVTYGTVQAVVGVGALAVQAHGMLWLLGYLGICFAGFWSLGAWVRFRAEERVVRASYESERFIDSAKGRKTRMPQTVGPHEIQEIAAPSEGRTQEDQKTRD